MVSEERRGAARQGAKMTPRQYDAPSVRQLAAVVDEMTPLLSEQRLWQLQMVVGMWDRAVRTEGMPADAGKRAANLFTRPVLARFWELAVAGELRQRGEIQPLSPATERIVRDCLAILARRVVPGKRLGLPVLWEVEAKSTVGQRGLAALYRGLVDIAGAGPLDRNGTALSFEDRTRLLAMVAIVLDSGARSGELAALRLPDVAAGEVAVRIRRRQQKAPPNRYEEIAAIAEVHPSSVKAVVEGQLHQRSEATRQRVLAAVRELEALPEAEWYELREGTRVVLRRWLEVREGIVDSVPVEGGRSALWVTLSPSKAGPPGVTIRPQGLRQAYARGITALNWVMAGQYGWEPMPTRMEQLRRSVTAVPLKTPPV
jgi:hypothetical protein